MQETFDLLIRNASIVDGTGATKANLFDRQLSWPEALDAMVAALGEVGNASSVHAEGRAAHGKIEIAPCSLSYRSLARVSLKLGNRDSALANLMEAKRERLTPEVSLGFAQYYRTASPPDLEKAKAHFFHAAISGRTKGMRGFGETALELGQPRGRLDGFEHRARSDGHARPDRHAGPAPARRHGHGRDDGPNGLDGRSGSHPHRTHCHRRRPSRRCPRCRSTTCT